jgi:hypothetical protein
MEVGDPSFPRLLDALKAGVARAKDLKLNGRDATLCGEPLRLTPFYQNTPEPRSEQRP